ncbi:hypothetical protein [Pseudohaliea rubra]|uniref:Uncharacterized protein n=1 Tax=Pseudohaliea rubra DSM 19751 TaxID=1265313 RepID=A0A095VW35_9GAMM|nr:hypothetical protein [Pseudohaliea rubra]KGE05263.1 hypothetical protein HRUBRA_00085 [Pseudohaliea rubra DSM 19751]
MNVHVLETDGWSLLLPPEWWAEREEDTVVIGDRDGVGCIEISELRPEAGPVDDASLATLAAAIGGEGRWTRTMVAGVPGLYAAGLDGDAALREWCLGRGAIALYITYSCDLANRGMDDSAVDEILGTLALDPDLS